MHVLVTRAEPDAALLASRIEALGHRVTIEPLMRIEPLALPPDALEGAAALVVTSRNALRSLAVSPLLAQARQLPLIAVGSGSAGLARELGFPRVIEGRGSAAELVPELLEVAAGLDGKLVHLHGEKLAYDLAGTLSRQGVGWRGVLAYRALAAEALQPPTRALLAGGEIDAVTLMSPRTAAIFARLALSAGLRESVEKLAAICFSPAVAEALDPLRPRRVEIAEQPDTSALLAAITRVATLWSGV